MNKFKELKILSQDTIGKVSVIKNIYNDRLYIHKYIPLKQKSLYEKLKRLNCLYLPKIYSIKDLGSKVEILEEYIYGRTLENIQLKDEFLLADNMIEYMEGICTAVSALHSIGIIHKDISPKNIVISTTDKPVLIDFDISKQQIHNTTKQDTNIMGTYGYASPEHFGFKPTDQRSDIYSLGVLMNMMFTGQFPNQKLVSRFKYPKLYKIIKKCIQIDPNKRYQNVASLYHDLNSINFNRYDDIQISDYIKRCDDMLTLESRMAHKQYYKAIITIEKYLNSKNQDTTLIPKYVVLLSQCYESLEDIDKAIKVLFDYIYSQKKISPNNLVYKRLISLSDKLSIKYQKELLKVRKCYIKDI